MTLKEFNKEVSENENVIVDFYADWCTPCKQLDPILEEIENEYNTKILKINIEESIDLVNEYKIMKIPSLYFYKNGELTGQCKSLKKKNEIISNLNLA